MILAEDFPDHRPAFEPRLFSHAIRRKEHVPAARRRAIHVQRVAALCDRLAVA